MLLFNFKRNLKLLAKAKTYISKGKELITSKMLGLEPKLSSAPVCLGMVADNCYFLHSTGGASDLKINLYESLQVTEEEDYFTKLAEIVKKNKYENVPCSWILQPSEYQVIITDELPVEDAEFQAAIRWKIKDLVRFPAEDLLIDSFPLPPGANSSQNKIMVVVSKMSEIISLREKLTDIGLKLIIVDIPEMSLRNILNLYPKEGYASAILYIKDKNAQLIVVFEHNIYVTRNLMISKEVLKSAGFSQLIERLHSEISRSFEYFYKSIGKQVPMQVIFASSINIDESDIDLLAKRIDVPFIKFDASHIFVGQEMPDITTQAKYLNFIGGLLR